MIKRRIAIFCACLLSTTVALNVIGAEKLFKKSGMVRQRYLRWSGKIERYKNLPSKKLMRRAAQSTITISYTNFTDEQKAACEYAKTIWQNAVKSTVEIKIKAEMKDQGDGVLGGAGPSNYYKDFTNAPKANTYYVTALAEALAGTNLNGTDPEINMAFNTRYANDYYYGTDGNCPDDKMDFVSLVLHEICHGLGFISTCGIDAGKGYFGGGTDTATPMGQGYCDENGKKVTAYTNESAELATLFTSTKVFFTGANAGTIPIHSPATFQQGSSLDHVADSYNGGPDALMTWSMGNAEVQHSLGTVVPNIFKDLGWNADGGATTPAIGVSVATLSPSATAGSDATATSFTVHNSGTGTLSYTVSDDADWLSCSPTTGDSTGSSDKDTIAVTYSTSSLSAGTHTATITVADKDSKAASKTIGVTLTVSAAPATANAKIALSVSTLTPKCDKGKDATAASFTVGNDGDAGSTLSYAVADDASWLACSPASGTVAQGSTAQTISVTYDTDSLSAGSHTGTISVTDSSASNSPQKITVTLTVADTTPSTPTIALSTSSLTPACNQGANADAATFTISNDGTSGSSLSYAITDDVDWLSCSPESGSVSKARTASTITVTYKTDGLTAGTHKGTISVTDSSATNSPQTIAVTLTVAEAVATPKPAIFLSSTAFSPTCNKNCNADATSFTIENVGDSGSTLNYAVTDNVDWLSCTPESGTVTTSAATIAVKYNTNALTVGVHSAVITVTDGGASNSPQTIAVTLTVADGYSVTIGATFEVKASSCVEAGIESFEKKPKVYAVDGGKKCAAKVVTKVYPADVVVCEWKRPMAAGAYSLWCQPKGYDAELVSEKFDVEGPAITAITSTKVAEKETKKGVFYDVKIELTGRYFGSKKAKVYFEYEDAKTGRIKKKKFKSTGQTYDFETGDSTFEGIAKRIPADAEGVVVIDIKKVGTSEISMTSTFAE